MQTRSRALTCLRPGALRGRGSRGSAFDALVGRLYKPFCQVACQQISRLQQMHLQYRDGPFRIARAQGIEYLRVLIVRLIFVGRHAELQSQISFPLTVERIDQRRQARPLRRRVQRKVELPVVLDVKRLIAGGVRTPKYGRDIRETLLGMMRRRESQRSRFERSANFVDLAHFRRAQGGDARAMIRL
jgi:hypothetical protein